MSLIKVHDVFIDLYILIHIILGNILINTVLHVDALSNTSLLCLDCIELVWYRRALIEVIFIHEIQIFIPLEYFLVMVLLKSRPKVILAYPDTLSFGGIFNVISWLLHKLFSKRRSSKWCKWWLPLLIDCFCYLIFCFLD
jgi:hypothetical protein